MGDAEDRLRQAAEVIRDQAASNAGWSGRIPGDLKVSASGMSATISTGVPPAYPNEFGVRHPVFGGRGTKRPKAPWVRNKHRPFLGPAGDQKADEAARIFGLFIDDWALSHGYR